MLILAWGQSQGTTHHSVREDAVGLSQSTMWKSVGASGWHMIAGTRQGPATSCWEPCHPQASRDHRKARRRLPETCPHSGSELPAPTLLYGLDSVCYLSVVQCALGAVTYLGTLCSGYTGSKAETRCDQILATWLLVTHTYTPHTRGILTQ